jgi:hypothetical protein
VFTNAPAAQAATAPANQVTLTISNTTLTAIPGSTITLTTSGGSGTGAVSYSVSGTGCSVSGSSLTASAAATCVVTATKAASTGFNAVTSATKSFSFANANQATLTVSNTTLTAIPGSTIILTTTGGSGTGAVSFSVSGNGCSNSGNSLTASTAATCVVTATKAASTGFNLTTSSTKSFVFQILNQATLSISNNSLTNVLGTSITLSTSGGSGTGAVNYSVNGASCTLNGNILSATATATCTVSATKAESTGYNATSSATKTFIFQIFDQAAFSIANSVLSILPGSSLTLITTGGSGPGAISYTVNGADCSLNGNTLSAAVATTCSVSATKDASTGYNAITSATKNFVFQLSEQATLSISTNNARVSILSVSKPIALSTIGGSGTGAVSFSVTGEFCRIGGAYQGQMYTGEYLVVTGATTCVVTATKEASTGYKVAVSVPKSFEFVNINQNPLAIINTDNLRRAGSGYTIATSGGSGTGVLSLSTSSPGCIVGTSSITGLSLDSNIATSCVITATKAGSLGYNAVTSPPITLYFEIVNQAPLVISNNVFTKSVASYFPLTTTGGSGPGEVTFSASGPGCIIDSRTQAGFTASTTNTSSPSTCSVTASKAASTGWNAVTSAPVNFNFIILDQAPLVISNTVTSKSATSYFPLTTTGGSGSGEITFSTSSPGCIIEYMVRTQGGFTVATTDTSNGSTCAVTATKAASTGYNQVVSTAKIFTFTKP